MTGISAENDRQLILERISMGKTTHIYCDGNDPRCQGLDRNISYTMLYQHLATVHSITLTEDQVIAILDSIDSSADWEDIP